MRNKGTTPFWAALLSVVLVLLLTETQVGAQSPGELAAQQGGDEPKAVAAASANATPPPADYTIGPGDVLAVLFWREADLSTEATVRPDGRISVPLINEVYVAGMTPEELREELTEKARRYVQDPSVTVVVKQINSRVVYITGEIGQPGPYALVGPTTVLQLISMAGGLAPYANKGRIVIMRTEDGEPKSYRFNYDWVIEGKNIRQNIQLKPGDTVVVP